MDSRQLISRGRLEHVEALLRDVLVRDFPADTEDQDRGRDKGRDTGNRGSLGRMLVHIVNIHRLVSVSTASDANAAKRLGDFAVTMERMASSNPDSARRLTRIAEALRLARSSMN